MTTIEVGQLVLDVETQRVWKLIQRDQYTDTNWIIELINDPLGTRSIGDRSLVRESWIERRCIDHSNAVDPPIGNGAQVAVIFDENGEPVERRDFTTAEDALAWLVDNLYSGQRGEWYGWLASANDDPDMTVLSVDGKLVWANASS